MRTRSQSTSESGPPPDSHSDPGAPSAGHQGGTTDLEGLLPLMAGLMEELRLLREARERQVPTVATSEPAAAPTPAVHAGETSEQRFARATQQLKTLSDPGETRRGVGPAPDPWVVAGEPPAQRPPDISITAPSWDGKREELETFLDQCSLHFDLNPTRYPTDGRRVLWALAHITGVPRDRLRNLCQARPDAPLFHQWEQFTGDLRRTYGDPNPGHTARVKLQRLRQTGSVSAHAAKFLALVTKANATDNQQLLTTFQLSLRESLRQRLLHVETQDLQEYIDAAIRTEQRMYEIGLFTPGAAPPASGRPQRAEHRRERAGADAAHHRRDAKPGAPSSKGPQGAGDLPDEVRRFRRENGLCFGCGGKHAVRDCPKASQTQPLRANMVVLDPGTGTVLVQPEPEYGGWAGADLDQAPGENRSDPDEDAGSELSYDPGHDAMAFEGDEPAPHRVARAHLGQPEDLVDLRAHMGKLIPPAEPVVTGDTIRIHRHPSIPAYKCWATLNGYRARALIDGGATASFVTHALASEQADSLEPLPRPVHTATFDSRSGAITHRLSATVGLAGIAVAQRHPFYVAPSITNYDAILGMDWIEATEPLLNYKTQTMHFPIPGRSHFATAPVVAAGPPLLADLDDPTGERCFAIHPGTDAQAVTGAGAGVDPAIPPEYHKFQDVFNESNADALPPRRPHDHAITLLPGAQIPHGALYSLSAKEMEELKAYLDKMLAIGFIRPSKSPAAAPIIFVPKKDGRLRLCVDYRALNSVTVKDKYPIPLISEHLDSLARASVYTKLDLKGAYNLVRIAPGDEWKTAFRTRYGSYKYLVMPFGLCNAPSTFQRLMNQILHDLLDVTVVVYLDDILVYSEDSTEHVGHVKEVLRRLQQHRLYCAPDKCEFHADSVEFLGYRVSPSGVCMDPAKVEAVTSWPVPTSIRDIQVFLGFANFYRRFIRHYSRVAAPLTDRLKGKATGKIHLEPTEVAAFKRLKRAFTTAPVLKHFDPARPTVVETDASDYVVAAVLSQWYPLTEGSDPTPSATPAPGPSPPRPSTHRLHPVAYWSRKMQPAERNYEIHDKELLAIVDALATWRHYLHGLQYPFEVLTDHQALQYFQTKRQLNRQQARWSVALSEFDFTITYRPGAQATRPDALLRRSDAHPLTVDANAHHNTDNQFVLLPDRLFARSPTAAVATISPAPALSADAAPSPPVNIPAPDQIPEILQRYHDHPTAGHPGVAATIALVRRYHDWPSLRKDVTAYVASCAACQRAKAPWHKPYGLLLPLPAPARPFGSLTMDHIEGLPFSKVADQSYDSILVVVDRLTKYALFLPAHKTDDVPALAQSLMSCVFCYFGLPDDIVSDRGRTFVAALWKEILAGLGTKSSLSTAYHPQSDGQTERMNQSLEVFLRFYVNYQQDDWAKWLPYAQLALNNRLSATTTLPPCLPLFGFTPKTLPGSPALAPNGVGPTPETFASLITICQANIARAGATMAKYANRSRMDRSFARGDQVLLRTRHLKHDRPSRKLANPLAGPFRILDAVGSRAYRLDLPGHWRVHPVFHVSLLEPYPVPTRPSTHAPPAQALQDDREEFEVEAIQSSRRTSRGLQYRVKWAGYSEPTWEPAAHLEHSQELVQEYHAAHPTAPGPRETA